MAVIKYCHLFFNLLLLTLLMNLRGISGFADVGDECQVSSELSGVCTVVYKCALAVSILNKGRQLRMKRCGFTKEQDEVVCCPTSSTTPATPTMGETVKSPEEETTTQVTTATKSSKRKCDEFCEEISKIPLKFVEFYIIGGEDSATDEFPHMAALGYNVDDVIQWNCGASIISKNSFLTAAHCFTKQVLPTKVRVGVTKLNDTNFQDFDIQNITVHERYDFTTKHNDIALVRIKGEMKFSKNIYPACLYNEDDDPENMIITGWGQTINGTRSNVLQKAPVVAYDLDKCNVTYTTRSMGSRTIDRSQFCVASPKENTSSCWGDSGGPCQIRKNFQVFSIVGIISFGAGCAPQTPAVYTRVSEYIDWIEKHVWN